MSSSTLESSTLTFPADAPREFAGQTAYLATQLLSTAATLLGQLVPSAQPSIAFGALAEACLTVVADECTVELIEDGSDPYRLVWPKSALRMVPDLSGTHNADNHNADNHNADDHPALASAVTRELLHSGQPVLVTDRVMAVAIVGIGGPGAGYLGAIVCARHEPYSRAEAEMLRLVVDRCVALVGHERAHVAANDALAVKAANLELALASNREIGVAMGILVGQRGCTPADAFALLRQCSQDTNRKLRDIAESVVRTGVLDVTPIRTPRGGARTADPAL